jgi:hypothetical protein
LNCRRKQGGFQFGRPEPRSLFTTHLRRWRFGCGWGCRRLADRTSPRFGRAGSPAEVGQHGVVLEPRQPGPSRRWKRAPSCSPPPAEKGRFHMASPEGSKQVRHAGVLHPGHQARLDPDTRGVFAGHAPPARRQGPIKRGSGRPHFLPDPAICSCTPAEGRRRRAGAALLTRSIVLTIGDSTQAMLGVRLSPHKRRPAGDDPAPPRASGRGHHDDLPARPAEAPGR